MTALRTLNAKGIAKFREYLADIRAGEPFQGSPALLYVDEYSAAVRPRIEIEQQTHKTKLDAAKYLATVLEPVDGPRLAGDTGVWSWLALFFFDQLAPVRHDGRRRPREDYHYIPSNRHPARHLLIGPYTTYKMHGEHARLLLHPPVHQHGRFLFDLASRRDLITNRGLIELADRLYWNAKTRRPKRGASSERQPGNLRRLIAVAQQLDFNYDLYGMNAQEILALLPEREFESWLTQGSLTAGA
jgi:hypothetical protein